MGNNLAALLKAGLGLSILCVAAEVISAGMYRSVQIDEEFVTLRNAVEEVAALSGEPNTVSAGGITSEQTSLLTIENQNAYGRSSRRRLVIVAGLDGDRESANIALDALRWFKTSRSDQFRREWDVSVMPLANPDNNAVGLFPPFDGFFNDPARPELRYVWRWVTYQAPDLVVELRTGSEFRIEGLSEPGSLTAALVDPGNGNGLGTVLSMLVTAQAADGPLVLPEIFSRAQAGRSALRDSIEKRVGREPLAIARLLAERYPGEPGMGYIPAVAWVHTLRLAEIVDDPALRAKVLREVRPWLGGARPLVGERLSFAGIAGTMVFGELAKAADETRSTASRLAAEGVTFAASELTPGTPEHGSGWSDDVFLGTIAAATAADPGGLSVAVRLIKRYANLLQQSSGLWHHSPEAPFAWGRGNGFAALGLAEVLTVLSPQHAEFSDVLQIYKNHMAGMRLHQAPDGLWNQVVDVFGSYRETSVTALTVTAMARGLRLGWLDDSYRPVVERAWQGILSRVVDDGRLVDVCISTGAGLTLGHYLNRTAVNGPDDRGGALVMGASLEVHAMTIGR